MERIGIAASKMAKGNLVLYNFYVLLLAFLISLILFLVAGSAIFLALVAIGFIAQGVVPDSVKNEWLGLLPVCMISLTVTICLIALYAIVKNLKFRKN